MKLLSANLPLGPKAPSSLRPKSARCEWLKLGVCLLLACFGGDATAQTSSRVGTGTATVTTISDGLFTYIGANTLPAAPTDTPSSFQIPALSLVNLGDGIGAAASAQLRMNSVGFANRFALNIESDGYLNQNTRIVRLTSLSGSGTVKMDNNGFFITGDGASTEFSGSLIGGLAGSPNSGAGNRFDKQGTSSLTLSGANTSVAAFYVTGGTLQFAKQVSLYNNDTSKWTAGNITVSSGAMLGLNVGGTGEFTAANLNTLLSIGGTTGTAGSGAKGFLDGSAIGLDTSNAVGGSFVYGGSVSDTNGGANGVSLTKLGTGALVLSGSSTYTGATQVRDGTLQLGNGGTTGSITGSSGVQLSSAGSILKTNRSDDAFIDLAIAGDGRVEIANSSTGNTVLRNAANAYAGTTTVTSGTLQVGQGGVGKSGQGATTVGSGSYAAVLAGTGTVGGTANVTDHLVQSAAMISPGDEAGTLNGGLTFSGNLRLADDSSALFYLTGATLNVGNFGGNAIGSAGYYNFIDSQIASWNGTTPGDHDWITVNGQLTLGANAAGLIVLADNGYVDSANAGDVFDIADWTSIDTTSFLVGTNLRSGGLGGGYLNLPDLSSRSLAWDTSRFATSGVILVVSDPMAIPEPSRVVLVIGGAALGLLRRRRSMVSRSFWK